jgi:hypothetical protein
MMRRSILLSMVALSAVLATPLPASSEAVASKIERIGKKARAGSDKVVAKTTKALRHAGKKTTQAVNTAGKKTSKSLRKVTE